MHTKTSLVLRLPFILGVSLFAMQHLLAAEEAQTRLMVQAQGLSLVKDRRIMTLTADTKSIVLNNISRDLRPETFVVTTSEKEKDFKVIEEKLEIEQPSYSAMIRRLLGKTVKYTESDPDLGREVTRQGKLITIDEDGLMILTDRKIETHVQARIQFDDFPDGFSADPCVKLVVQSHKAGPQTLDLTYLTSGFNWSAHYVSDFSEADDIVDFYGYITLANATTLNLEGAKVDLVAAAPTKVSSEARAAERVVAEMALAERQTTTSNQVGLVSAAATPSAVSGSEVQRQNRLFQRAFSPMTSYAGLSRFSIDFPISLAPQETKRIQFLRGTKIKGHRQFWLKINNDVFQDENALETSVPVMLVVSLTNKKDVLSGQPLPEGPLTVLRRTLQGATIIQDTAYLSETAAGGQLALPLGHAEGIEAKVSQTDFKRLGERVVEVGYRVDIRNNRKSAAQIKIVASVPKEAQILRETHPHRLDGEQSLMWTLDVPSSIQTELRYRLRVVQ